MVQGFNQAAQIDGRTRLISLFGSPVDHSASPAMHTLSFEMLGLNAVYLAFDVQPEHLPAAVGALRVLEGWDGANVTMPCKQAIIACLDELSDAAKLIGAVNVVKKEPDGRLTGHNVDGVGFMRNVRKHGVDMKGASMALAGPGGAGSAILVQAALDGVSRIDVLARAGGTSWRHAEALAKAVRDCTGCAIELFDIADESACAKAVGRADVFVNASSVGMGEGCTDTPVPSRLLRADLVVADAVYLPRETKLICDAKAKGCVTVPGLGMLLEQAAESELIWYGVEMPVDEVARLTLG